MSIKHTCKEIEGPFSYKDGTRTLHNIYSLGIYNGDVNDGKRYFFDKESLYEAYKLEDPFSHSMAFSEGYLGRIIQRVTQSKDDWYKESVVRIQDMMSLAYTEVLLTIGKVVVGKEVLGDVEVELIGMIARYEVIYRNVRIEEVMFFDGYVGALRAAMERSFSVNLEAGDSKKFNDIASFQEELNRLIPKETPVVKSIAPGFELFESVDKNKKAIRDKNKWGTPIDKTRALCHGEYAGKSVYGTKKLLEFLDIAVVEDPSKAFPWNGEPVFVVVFETPVFTDGSGVAILLKSEWAENNIHPLVGERPFHLSDAFADLFRDSQYPINP